MTSILLSVLPGVLTPAPVLPVSHSGTQDAAGRHPAGAQIYLEVPDVPGLRAAYARTAYAGALGDEELHASLGAVLGREPLDPLDWLRAEYEAAVEREDLPPLREIFELLHTVSFSVEIEGGVAAVLGHLDEAAGPEDVLHALGDRLAVQLDVSFAGGEAAELFEEVVRGAAVEGGEPIESAAVEGLEVWTLGDPASGAALRTARVGSTVSLLVGGLDAADARRLRGEAPGLSTEAWMEEAAEHWSAEGTPVLVMHNSLAAELFAVPDLQPAALAIDLAETLFGTAATMILRGGSWRVTLDAGGRFVTEGVHPAPRTAFERILGSQPLDRAALTLVHPEAIVATVTHLDRDAVLEALEIVAAETGGDPLGEIEKELGFRPDQDLLRPLGPAIAYSLPAPRSLLSAPPFTFAVALEPGGRSVFEPGLERVLQVVEERSEGFVLLESSSYRDMRILSLRLAFDTQEWGLPVAVDPAVLLRPTFVVMDDRVFLTTLPQHAKKEVRRLVRDEVETHGTLLAADLPEGVSEIGFADWIQFFGQVYSGARAMAGIMGAMGEEEMGIDVQALPDAEIVTRHFEPTLRWRRAVEGGILRHEVSSFGPEGLVLLGGGMLAGVLVSRAHTIHAPAEPSTISETPANLFPDPPRDDDD